MNLALVLGQQGEKVKPKLSNIKDNLRIDCYMNIPNFIDSSLKRDLRYDRVIVLSKLANDVGMKDLAKYWKKHCKETEIIFLCKARVDEELAKKVLKEFVSTKVAAMLVETTTLATFSECVLLDTEKITQKYGIEKYLSVEVDDGGGLEFKAPEEKKPETAVESGTPVQPGGSQVTPPIPPVQPEKTKKKGLFGKLFGGKKKNQQQVQQQEQQTQPESTDEEAVEDVVESIPAGESPLKNDYTIKPDLDVEEAEEEEPTFEPEIPETPPSIEEDEEFDDIENEQSSEEVSEDYSNTGEDEEDFEDAESEKQKVTQPTASTTHPNKRREEVNDFDLDAVEVDFGDVTFDASSVAPAMSGSMVGVADEVEDEEEVLSGSENQYRDAYNTQRVPQKSGKAAFGGNSALANIYNGKSHKVIIVTGDRGSGVTITAYSIAKEFAKKVPVLYFDCDIDRHGLLSYIDYEFFRTFDNSMIEGIKRCRDSSIFMNCIVNYDVNFDLLTSDYSCDADDESVRMAHNIVAENVMNYGVVVVDCPVSKLHLIQDLIFIGNTIVCMESSKRGVMNMLCGLEDSPLELRYKRCICSKGIILATKINKRIKSDRVLRYADSIFASNGVDWLHMEHKDFTGNLTTELLNEIVEG